MFTRSGKDCYKELAVKYYNDLIIINVNMNYFNEQVSFTAFKYNLRLFFLVLNINQTS